MLTRFSNSNFTPNVVVSIVMILGFLSLMGCATSGGYSADKGPELPEVQENVDAYRDATVIWGGTILKLDNADDHTTVEILALPLERGGRPYTYKNSPGRFIARINKFLEPENFKKGSSVTVSGAIQDSVVSNVGEYPYTYPVVVSDEITLWPKVSYYRPRYPRYGFGYGYGHYPFYYHRYRHHYGHRHHGHRNHGHRGSLRGIYRYRRP